MDAVAEAARMGRLYGALSQVNQAIARSKTPAHLLRAVCHALVDRGELVLVWVGHPDPVQRRVHPLVHAGNDGGYLSRIVVSTEDEPGGRGPTGLAYRTSRPYICNDFLSDPATAPWRAAVGEQAIGASAALPILIDGQPHYVLNVYARERGYFRDKEVGLLLEVAADLSFALEALAQEALRREAEHLAQREQHFSLAMIESMPGILYFYDEQGRFLRWNQNFMRVSGYSADEIAHMHPLDFFAPDDKALLADKIAEVHASGEASVEADFLSKDGRRTPYVFTGKRVMFDGVPCLVGVGMDIAARRQAQLDLEDHARRLQATSRKLMDVQEAERRSLARELHDSVGQELTALSLNLSIIRATLPTGVPEAIAARLQDSQTLLEDTTRHLRNVMVALRPPGLDELGLMAALRDHAQKVAQRSGLKLQISGADPQPRLPAATEIALFRIAQEALHNSVKHADATELGLVLQPAPGGAWYLQIWDDGRGFDASRRVGQGLDRMGTTTMRERAEAIGARLQLDARPGRGTRITVDLPPSAQAAAQPAS
jgi:PAS domain S-box-containing protein